MSDDLFQKSEDFVKNLLKEQKYIDVENKVKNFLKLCDEKNLIKFPKSNFDEYFRKADTRALAQICIGLAEREIEINVD